MKKLIAYTAALLMSSAALAAAPTYNGTVVGGVINTRYVNDKALSSVVFNCNDPVYGHFDMCIDMVFMVRQNPKVEVFMDSTIAPHIAQKYPNVLTRYSFHMVAKPGELITKVVTVRNARNADYQTTYLIPNQPTYFTRSSTNGGVTWSKLAVERR